jgi:plastocyanin
LHENFDLPTRAELLGVEAGDYVQIIFTDDTNVYALNTERMWVQVTETGTHEFRGTLDNEPAFLEMEVGDEVVFHPYDVINIYVP